MNITEWENAIQEVRAKNGWTITIECVGVWIITINDKETGKYIASTGMTGICGLPQLLAEPEKYFDFKKQNEH